MTRLDPNCDITIDQFLRGAFDCGHEAAVFACTNGHHRISVYEVGSDQYHSRYREANGESWRECLMNYQHAEWKPSVAEAVAAVKAGVDW